MSEIHLLWLLIVALLIVIAFLVSRLRGASSLTRQRRAVATLFINDDGRGRGVALDAGEKLRLQLRNPTTRKTFSFAMSVVDSNHPGVSKRQEFTLSSANPSATCVPVTGWFDEDVTVSDPDGTFDSHTHGCNGCLGGDVDGGP